MSFFGPMDGTRHWTNVAGGPAAAPSVRRYRWFGRIPRGHPLVRLILAWWGA